MRFVQENKTNYLLLKDCTRGMIIHKSKIPDVADLVLQRKISNP
jgi:hypothetical protein